MNTLAEVIVLFFLCYLTFYSYSSFLCLALLCINRLSKYNVRVNSCFLTKKDVTNNSSFIVRESHPGGGAGETGCMGEGIEILWLNGTRLRLCI